MTDRQLAKVDFGPLTGVADVAVDEGGVWDANEGSDAVWEIPPSFAAVSRTISVGAIPVAVAVGAGSVCTANSGDGTVSRIDPVSGAVTSIAVGGTPRGIAVGDGLVWVAIG